MILSELFILGSELKSTAQPNHTVHQNDEEQCVHITTDDEGSASSYFYNF